MRECGQNSCKRPADGTYGPNNEPRCFDHGMQILEDIRNARISKTLDFCPDGPWCGCDQHRRGAPAE